MLVAFSLTAARFQWYWTVRRDGTSPKEGEVQLDVKVDSEPEQLLRTFELNSEAHKLSTNPSHLPFLNQTWQWKSPHFFFSSATAH